MADAFVKLDLTTEAVPYQGAASILFGDLRKICEYIEPTDDNLKVYSHRIYELFIRTCTEWESLCKDVLIATGSKEQPEKMTIQDYVSLENSINLGSLEVGLVFWNPKTKYIRPYENWVSSNPHLAWYKDHHIVKHNRNTKFRYANFQNLLLAMAGLFALHARVNFVAQGGGDTIRALGNQRQYTFKNHLFSLRDDVILSKAANNSPTTHTSRRG